MTLAGLLLLAGCVRPPAGPLPPDPAYDPPGPDWVPAAAIPEGVGFISRTEALRYGSIVRVWFMVNLPRTVPPLPDGRRSSRYRAEFDCSLGRDRFMLMSRFTGVNGTGRVLAENEPGVSGWVRFAPDSVAAANARVACGVVPAGRM